MEDKLTNIEKLLEQITKLTANPIIVLPSKEELEMKGKLAKKMASVIAKTGNVQKKGVNKEQNYKFVSHADIIEELRKVIAEAGIYVLPKPDTYDANEIQSKFGTKGLSVIMRMNFEIIDAETGYSMTMHWFGQGMDYGDKAFYKSYTGALKYFLLDTFMLSTGDDPENDSPENHSKTPPPARPVQITKPVVQTPGMIPAQADIIKKLISQKGKTNEDIDTGIAKFYAKLGYKHWTDLTSPQADALIKQLERMPDLQPEDTQDAIVDDGVDPVEVEKGIEKMRKESNKK